jgi:hypothetical protein
VISILDKRSEVDPSDDKSLGADLPLHPAAAPAPGVVPLADPEPVKPPADEAPSPEDTFTSYKLIDGTVAVSNAYYNEQMLIHGHAANWAKSTGLRLVRAEQRDGYVLISCVKRLLEDEA